MATDRKALDLDRELRLAELVNRVLDRGAMITGEVVVGVAGIDLIYVGLQVVVAAIESANPDARAHSAVTQRHVGL